LGAWHLLLVLLPLNAKRAGFFATITKRVEAGGEASCRSRPHLLPRSAGVFPDHRHRGVTAEGRDLVIGAAGMGQFLTPRYRSA
jgi:hypothetical protein